KLCHSKVKGTVARTTPEKVEATQKALNRKIILTESSETNPRISESLHLKKTIINLSENHLFQNHQARTTNHLVDHLSLKQIEKTVNPLTNLHSLNFTKTTKDLLRNHHFLGQKSLEKENLIINHSPKMLARSVKALAANHLALNHSIKKATLKIEDQSQHQNIKSKETTTILNTPKTENSDRLINQRIKCLKTMA